MHLSASFQTLISPLFIFVNPPLGSKSKPRKTRRALATRWNTSSSRGRSRHLKSNTAPFCFYKLRCHSADVFLCLSQFPLVLRHYRRPLSASGVLKYKCITPLLAPRPRTQLHNIIQINAEAALIPLGIVTEQNAARGTNRKGGPACSGSLKGQTAETKAVSESRAAVRPSPGERGNNMKCICFQQELLDTHLTW